MKNSMELILCLKEAHRFLQMPHLNKLVDWLINLLLSVNSTEAWDFTILICTFPFFDIREK